MADDRLKKQKGINTKLAQENNQLRMSVLNIRQMFESAVGDKKVMEGQLAQMQQFLLGAVLQARGKKLTLREQTFAEIDTGKYAGLNTAMNGSDLVMSVVMAETLEIPDEQE